MVREAKVAIVVHSYIIHYVIVSMKSTDLEIYALTL